MRAVVLAIPVPPPITGRVAVSGRMRVEFERRAWQSVVVDIGRRGARAGYRWRRMLRLMTSDLPALAFELIRRKELRLVYLAVDDGFGIAFTALAGGLCRLL